MFGQVYSKEVHQVEFSRCNPKAKLNASRIRSRRCPICPTYQTIRLSRPKTLTVGYSIGVSNREKVFGCPLQSENNEETPKDFRKQEHCGELHHVRRQCQKTPHQPSRNNRPQENQRELQSSIGIPQAPNERKTISPEATSLYIDVMIDNKRCAMLVDIGAMKTTSYDLIWQVENVFQQ